MEISNCQSDNGSQPRKGISSISETDKDYYFKGQTFSFTIERPNPRDPNGPKETIESKLTLTKACGKGGMGIVYKARTEGGSDCAVKLLDIEKNAEFIRQFEVEYDSTRKVMDKGRDIGIVEIRASGRTELTDSKGRGREVMYIIFPFINHEPLTGKKLPTSEAVRIISNVTTTVKNLHQLTGIVHRDIKPGNIFVEKETGCVFLSDFGLSKDLSETEGKRIEDSIAGQVKGTPIFMSPEQARGEKVDARSDIYSIGATLYYFLTRQLPVSGRNAAEIVGKIGHHTHNPLNVRAVNSEIPAELAEIVERCTEPKRENRYHSPEECAEELEHELKMYVETRAYDEEQCDRILKQETKPLGFFKRRFGSLSKEELEKRIRAHEKAAWLTKGRDRSAHQRKVLEYYEQLDSLELKTDIPRDIILAKLTIERQYSKGSLADEDIKPIKLEGWGRGKKQAEELINKMHIFVRKFWFDNSLTEANETLSKVEAEFPNIKPRWRPEVKKHIEHWRDVIKDSETIQNASIEFGLCEAAINSQDATKAKVHFDKAEKLLLSVPEEKKNPHFGPINEEDKRIFGLWQQEEFYKEAGNLKEEMIGRRKRRQFDEGHSIYRKLRNPEDGIITKRIHESDRRTELREDVDNEYKLLVQDEKLEEAEKLEKSVDKAIVALRYDDAQDYLAEINLIIEKHLQEDDYAGFRKNIEKKRKDVNLKMVEWGKFDSIKHDYETKVAPFYENEIEPSLSKEGEFPISALIKFNADMDTLLGRLDAINAMAIGGAYQELRRGMISFQKEATQNAHHHAEERFRAVREYIGKIKGENKPDENNENYEAAEQELDKARDIVFSVLRGEEDLRKCCTSLDKELRSQHDFAERVGRIRDALARGDVGEAEREYTNIKERKNELVIYHRVIDLESRRRGLPDEQAIVGYRQRLEAYKSSKGEEDMAGMLNDIEKSVYLGKKENPAAELRSLLEEQGRMNSDIAGLEDQQTKRSSQTRADELKEKKKSLKELQKTIDGKLDNLIPSLEADLPEARKELYKKLGQSYQDIKLMQKRDEYMGLV
jgi:serine/threonine protein kinase